MNLFFEKVQLSCITWHKIHMIFFFLLSTGFQKVSRVILNKVIFLHFHKTPKSSDPPGFQLVFSFQSIDKSHPQSHTFLKYYRGGGGLCSKIIRVIQGAQRILDEDRQADEQIHTLQLPNCNPERENGHDWQNEPKINQPTEQYQIPAKEGDGDKDQRGRVDCTESQHITISL